MIKLLLVLVAIVAMGRYDMKDITAYLKKEGSQFLSDSPYKETINNTVAAKKLEPGRKSGAYRLKASQKS